LGNVAKWSLELSTGFTSPDTKALGKWLIDGAGRSKYGLLFKLILGDLRGLEGKGPQDLNLPLQKYLEGADLVTSRTGWNKNDIAVYMFARHWDSARYEPSSGALSIYKNGEPILVRGITGKAFYDETNNSGIWIWNNDKKIRATLGQGSTYWSKLRNQSPRSYRAVSARDVLSEENTPYRPQTLTKFSIDDSVLTASTSFAKLLKYRGVEEVKRTIVHDASIVTITDIIKAPKQARVLVSFRLPEVPLISGLKAETSRAVLEISAQDAKLEWSGGEGKELIGPTGLWHGHKKDGLTPGYSNKPNARKKYGMGYLFIESTPSAGTYEIVTKVTIKD
ncbi:MAG: hypothetical protein AAF387_20600, partial [Pseudomonadota bacterium]